MHAGAGLPLANAAGVERPEVSSPPSTAPETPSRTTQILPHRSTHPVHSPCGPQGREGRGAIHLEDRARPRSDQGCGR